jgi:hypothetical protein
MKSRSRKDVKHEVFKSSQYFLNQTLRFCVLVAKKKKKKPLDAELSLTVAVSFSYLVFLRDKKRYKRMAGTWLLQCQKP